MELQKATTKTRIDDQVKNLVTFLVCIVIKICKNKGPIV